MRAAAKVRSEPVPALAAQGTNVGFFVSLVGKGPIWRSRHPGTAQEVTDRLARQVDKPLPARARCARRLECDKQQGRDDDLKRQGADHAA